MFFYFFAEKERGKGILDQIKGFVYEKAGWQVPTPAPEGMQLVVVVVFVIMLVSRRSKIIIYGPFC